MSNLTGALSGVMRVKTEKKDPDGTVTVTGQPVDAKTWFRFLLRFVRAGGEADKVVVFSQKSASIGTVWRLGVPFGLAEEIGENGITLDAEPAVVPLFQLPDDELPLQFGLRIKDWVKQAQYRVLVGLPEDEQEWKRMTAKLLTSGKAADICKSFIADEKEDALRYAWRVILKAEQAKPGDTFMEPVTAPPPEEKLASAVTAPLDLARSEVPETPAPRRPVQREKPVRAKVQLKPGARTISGKETDKVQPALDRWLVKGAALPPDQRPNKAAVAQMLKDYQERLRTGLVLDKQGRVVKMPIFNNYIAARDRLIFGNVTGSGAPSGFAPPAGDGVVLSLDQAWRGGKGDDE